MKRLGILGSGATSVYLLKHIAAQIEFLRNELEEIHIFEKSDILGMGMPYNPHTTDIHNLANIASEEIPELPQSFVEWIECQDKGTCDTLHLPYREASDSEVYSRLALGHYLQKQCNNLIEQLEEQGIRIFRHTRCEIRDVEQQEGACLLSSIDDSKFSVDRLVIATGHFWDDADNPKQGYYASPWPIQKLFPKANAYYDFSIGILGASLSAFDVVSSLARRHGVFTKNEQGKLEYRAYGGAENFKLCLHDVEGWLPHLQYEQEFPLRRIYRHVSREKLLELLDAEGYLRLHTFFDKVGRPALRRAFEQDGDRSMLESLQDPGFCFEDFAEAMIEKHEYPDAFEGMKQEMEEAYDSVMGKRPIHWKEVTDDLMYCLNYHAELLPAEDHLLLQEKIMPFLLNVIAAMPLQSAEILLALHEAGKVKLVPGLVEVPEAQDDGDGTVISVTHEGATRKIAYRIFVDCSGQQAVSWEEFPFPGMKSQQLIRPARAKFKNPETRFKVSDELRDRINVDQETASFLIGGIDIDASFRIIGNDGVPNPDIYDLNFTHTLGVRPYAYGLQACSVNSGIVVASWVDEIRNKDEGASYQEKISRIYEEAGEI